MNKKILYVHQAAELYGSDKTLLDLILGIDKGLYTPYVVLPQEGLLTVELKKASIPVFIMPVMKVSRGMGLFNIKGLYQNICSIYNLRKLDRKYQFDIVYTNTLATFLGAVYSFMFSKKHIWHIHEIIRKPRLVNQFFAFVVGMTSDKIIFNSTQSFENLSKENKKIIPKSIVIHNGVVVNKLAASKHSNNELINIGLIGRIHRWKGQFLLLDVFYKLSNKYNNIRLYFVGSTVSGLEFFQHQLEELVLKYKLKDKVNFIPFSQDIKPLYEAMDIVVVPSTEPEPFGMVTIEAMNNKRPVIASGHGGSLDIIDNGIDGLLFEPNNPIDLENQLVKLIENESLRISLAEKGFEKVEEKFSVNNYIQSISKVYESI